MPPFRKFLELSASHLPNSVRTELGKWSKEGAGKPLRQSWCSWTTFSRLGRDAGYWTDQLPLVSELGEYSVMDGGTWGQPFPYDDLAHIIIPRYFTEEYAIPNIFTLWRHEQDINGLAVRLNEAHINHTLSDYGIELKLF